jgi:predicted nucleotidyltransferase
MEMDAPRDPELGDLLTICKALNEKGAKYVIIGGMALVYHGFNRGTEDIDMIVERTLDNVERLKAALTILPDNAIGDMKDTDLETHGTVRVADEVVVDLMASACGIDFEQASTEVEEAEIEGIRIPFASPRLLMATKQTVREKDEIDRLFLQRLIESRETGHKP